MIAACFFFLNAAPGFAQEGIKQDAAPQADHKKPKVKHRNTPLDTIMQTKLWTDVPEPQDFVKQNRPHQDQLDYTPLTGTDPVRPKLRSASELKDLEAELESARSRADKKAGIKPSSASAPKTSKEKPPAPAQ